jgi:predicted dehydrogenase
MANTNPTLNRREFLRQSALLASGLSLAGCATSARRPAARRISANEKLNIGIIGAGGRGADNVEGVQPENIVALCDVDEARAAESFAKHPSAKRYQDYRRMLDAEKALDAVVVSVPDHSHALAAVTAMRLGKHVYCEKPLARTIWEARLMAATAKEMGVVTQMGQQGHAMEGSRTAVEVIRSGAIGDVRELHVWTDRPAGWWPQGVEAPTDTPPVPPGLNWDLWLGPAAWRPYNPIYVPFKWRGFYDFGTGPIGDMGVHNLDTAFWALELGSPTSAEVKESARGTEVSPPLWNILELQFPARGARPPVRLTFYDGKKTPPIELFQGEPVPTNGSLVIGSKGTLFTRTWHGGETKEDMFVLLPRRQFADYQPPAPTLPRTPEHHLEWIRACKGGPSTQSGFAYASVLTEALLVGLLAERTGHRIEWDAAKMRARGFPEADAYIHPEFRKGWSL